jgi:hypothetical protein
VRQNPATAQPRCGEIQPRFTLTVHFFQIAITCPLLGRFSQINSAFWVPRREQSDGGGLTTE